MTIMCIGIFIERGGGSGSLGGVFFLFFALMMAPYSAAGRFY